MDENRSSYIVHGWRNIPIHLHWSLFFWLLLCLAVGGGTVFGLLQFPCLITLTLIHEYGHAIAARMRGVQVFSIRLLMMHGLCHIEKPYSEFDDILIAWAGVLAQFAVLLATLPLIFLLNNLHGPMPSLLLSFLSLFNALNAGMIMFNLLPFKGLDGRKAWLIIPFALRRIYANLRPQLQKLPGSAHWRKQRALQRKSKVLADNLMDRLKSK